MKPNLKPIEWFFTISIIVSLALLAVAVYGGIMFAITYQPWAHCTIIDIAWTEYAWALPYVYVGFGLTVFSLMGVFLYDIV